MNTNNDFTVVADNPVKGDILAVAYLQGTGADTYDAADSLLMFARCYEPGLPLSLPLTGNKSMTIYRSLSHYTPAVVTDGITEVPAGAADKRKAAQDDEAYYTLQGLRTTHPQRGVYIRNAIKVCISR